MAVLKLNEKTFPKTFITDLLSFTRIFGTNNFKYRF